MPGFDDPRYLQQVITDLQTRLKRLEGSSLPFLSNQRGAVPGAMRAVSIGDQGLRSNMWLNLNGQNPGSAPYQAVTDAAGVVRVELGNLAANGVSAAQYGFRANKADGTPIFDSLGLIAVMSTLGTSSDTVGQNIAGPVSASTLTGCNVTFTLPRQQRVLSAMQVIAKVTLTTGFFAYSNFALDGSDGGAGNFYHHNVVYNSSTYVNGFTWRLDTLAAGSHTLTGTVDVDNGATINVFGSAEWCFGLGS